MYIPVNIQTLVQNLVWFLSTTELFALVDCISKPPARDSIQSLAGNPHVPDFQWRNLLWDLLFAGGNLVFKPNADVVHLGVHPTYIRCRPKRLST